MTTHRKILHIISIIRTAHPAMEQIYTEGGYLNFALLLHAIFPQGELYKDCDHVVCKIEGKYYDITGVVDGKDYAPFSAYYNKRRTARSFSLLLKANYIMKEKEKRKIPFWEVVKQFRKRIYWKAVWGILLIPHIVIIIVELLIEGRVDLHPIVAGFLMLNFLFVLLPISTLFLKYWHHWETYGEEPKNIKD